MVGKCCFCVDLKYGFLAYGTLCLAAKVGFLVMLFFMQPIMMQALAQNSSIDKSELPVMGSVVGLSAGWAFATAFALYLALMGIIQERSILLFPYIVMLVVEFIAAVIYVLVIGIVVQPLALLTLLFVLPINGYIIACIISLHRKFQDKGRKQETDQSVLVNSIY